MKKIKLMALASVLITMATNANAQTSATATATALILSPNSITKTADMNFGNILSDSAGGTVIVAPTGVRTGSAARAFFAGNVSAASFTVAGSADGTYTLSLPSTDIVLTHTNGASTMKATSFTSNVATTANAGILSTSGFQVIKVGATLTTITGQPAGLYVTSTPFIVTVNF